MDSEALGLKKQVANQLFKLLNPHMSSQLGANLGYGVNVVGSDLLPQTNEALKLWFEVGDSKKLIATIMASTALGVITEDEADEIIGDIKQIDKKAK